MIDLRHFKADEFRGFADAISPRLLVLLDVFRGAWGAPVRISPAPGTVGRNDGPTGTSDHNFDKWGEVRAVDVMPDGLRTALDAARAVDLAVSLGFEAVGLYPHWRPAPGLHLGVRPGQDYGRPAMWGAVRRGRNQVYVSLADALAEFPK